MNVIQNSWDQYVAVTEQVERAILDFFAAGWTPTGGFDVNGRSEFDSAIDLERIPTREWPFTHLSTALVPLMVYSLVLIVGVVLLRCRTVAQREQSQKQLQLIRAEYLYPVKFVYNVVQIFFCAYMSVEALIIAKREGYLSLECGAYYFEDPKVGELLWLFYVSKILDFMDTMFIIAICKRSQFSFLHCFHHFTVYFYYWLNVNINYDGEVYFTILANGFIHTIMYSYYWISMHIPKVKDEKGQKRKYGIWWKKYLTQMQMIQFLLMMSHALWVLYVGCKETPPRVVMMYFWYILSLYALFMNFFVRTYSRNKKKRE